MAAPSDPALREALATYLLALADDELIIGHRLSEWTGLGPIIEEDIACSSMAQDELGHSLTYHRLRNSLGFEKDPDSLNFTRPLERFLNAVLCELPRGDYGFTLVRQTLYDLAEFTRLEAHAEASSWEELAEASRKLIQEEKYHLAHGEAMTRRLATSTEESRQHIRSAFHQLFPYALGLFEPMPQEELLVEAGIKPSEKELMDRFLDRLAGFLEGTELEVPAIRSLDGGWEPKVDPVFGGRRGEHTEHLAKLLDAMQMLVREHPGAQW